MQISKSSNKEITFKVHQSKQTNLLAACDTELVGKKLKGNNEEFYVNPRFYKEKQCNIDEIAKLMKICNAGNLIGKKIVKIAIKLGIVTEDNLIYIGSIPHAQYIIMNN